MSPSKPLLTRFISADNAARMIHSKGLADCIAGMADYITADFLRWQEFEKVPRVAHHGPDGVIELMPISDRRLYAFKYVNGHPKNVEQGYATVMAFGVLADVDNGAPTLVCELTLTTALRTAATSALAARALARPNSRRMAIIGNGAQSEFQALAFSHLLGIERFHLYDTDPAATDKLMKHLTTWGLQAHRFSSAAEAVRGCDIITTLTADKTWATIIVPEMVEVGMHINAVGGDCPGKTELHPDVLANARVFVEYEPQTRIEGDIQQMPASFAVQELWQVLTGQQAGRCADTDITVFDSVGFALEDYSALRYMRDLAIEQGVEEHLSLIPALSNPKNLFGLIGSTDAAERDGSVPQARAPALRRAA